jgi:hypothetical protein
LASSLIHEFQDMALPVMHRGDARFGHLCIPADLGLTNLVQLIASPGLRVLVVICQAETGDGVQSLGTLNACIPDTYRSAEPRGLRESV